MKRNNFGRLLREMRRAIAGMLAIAAVKVTPKEDAGTLLAFVALFKAMAKEE